MKDYKILSIKEFDRLEGRILKVKDFSFETGAFLEKSPGNGEFNGLKDTIEYINKHFNIHSIKRLSDGKVFTVGDQVYWDWVMADLKYFTIAKFYMKEDGLYFDTKEDSAQGFHLDYYYPVGQILLKKLEHYDSDDDKIYSKNDIQEALDTAFDEYSFTISMVRSLFWKLLKE